MLLPDRGNTQRERLLEAMIRIVGETSYAEATIAEVIGRAGVSRPTFYEYFADKEACFLACVADVQQRLLADVRQGIASGPPERAVAGAVAALVGFAADEPALAHLLANEAMSGGPRVLDARDQGIVQAAQLIEHAQSEVPATTPTPDISPLLLLGTVQRLVARRLRREERELPAIVVDLLSWVESYDQPAGRHRWRTLRPTGPSPKPLPLPPESMLRAPPPLPSRKGRRREDVTENHRQRILFATAEVGKEKGYTHVTAADITRRAGVDRRAFNSLFADKQAAFEAVHELGFERTIAVNAAAFFAGGSWPERIWEAARSFTQFFEGNRTIAHVGFVESTAVGAAATKRLEDTVSAFSIFLQEGYGLIPPAVTPPTPLALEAIATTIMEMGYRACRRDSDYEMEGLRAHLAFLCLAPFMSATGANEFIDEALGR